jgi:hypothetical protein
MRLLVRLRFVAGIIFVFMLVGVLVLYLNSIMSVVHSKKANLNADASTIGSDYSGHIVNQTVEEGDKVKKGQELFQIKSPMLDDLLSSKTLQPASLPFAMTKEGDILIRANDDGIVQRIMYRNGSFVPAGSILANVNNISSLYVEAHYQLAPPDYARIKKDSRLIVTFPDNSRVTASVYNIALVSDGNAVDTVIKGRLSNANMNDFRFSDGTPVQTSLQLSERTWYQNTYDFLHDLFTPGEGK